MVLMVFSWLFGSVLMHGIVLAVILVNLCFVSLLRHHIMVNWNNAEPGPSIENVQWLIWFTGVRFVHRGCNTL